MAFGHLDPDRWEYYGRIDGGHDPIVRTDRQISERHRSPR
jgi:hypothetical protein